MKTAFLISVMAPLALFGAFADKDWVKRTFAPTNAAAVADAAAVTNAQQAAAISDLQGGKQDKLPYATNAIPDSAIVSAATWNAKQDAISDYTTTGAVHSIVSGDVASWAMAGQPQPLGSVTDVKVDGTSVVSNGVADITMPEPVDLSGKQDVLKIPVSFGEWNYEAIEGGSHIGEISYPYGSSWYVGLRYVGETGMTVVLATHADGSGVKAADNPTEAYAEWSARGGKPTVRVRIYRTSVLAPVSDGVDVYPHSFGSNTLVTSKGVYDAMSTKATMGYIGLNVAPEWAANTAYSAGDYVTTSIDGKRYLFRSTMNHTSGSSFPVGSNEWMDVTDYVTYVAEAAAWNKSRTKADASALSSKADKSYVDAASNNVLTAAMAYADAAAPNITAGNGISVSNGVISVHSDVTNGFSRATKTSDLTNDSGFITSSDIYVHNTNTASHASKQDKLFYTKSTATYVVDSYDPRMAPNLVNVSINGQVTIDSNGASGQLLFTWTGGATSGGWFGNCPVGSDGSFTAVVDQRYGTSLIRTQYHVSSDSREAIVAEVDSVPNSSNDKRLVTSKGVADALSGKVPTTRTVNGHPLSSDVTIPIPTKVSDLSIDSATTNVIREVTGTFWDPGLTVTWRMFCTNGNFYVSAITNVNVTGVQ